MQRWRAREKSLMSCHCLPGGESGVHSPRAATASVQGLSISLPKPSNKPAEKKHEIKIVQIAPEGGVMLNGARVSLEQVEALLGAARARDPEMSVLIKGDPRTQYQRVMTVVDLCNRRHLGRKMLKPERSWMREH